MNKSSSSVNLSLELHVVSTFWLESNASINFSLYFAQSSFELERPALNIHKLWCRTDTCSWKLPVKVSLILDNPILFLCKLKHTSVYFIQKEEHENYLQIADSVHKAMFFLKKVIPGVLSRLVNFNIT